MVNKRKVGIITQHRVVNYGSVLQTYALQKKIEELDYDCEVIDYYPERFTPLGMLKRIKDKGERFKNSLIIRTIARIVICPSYFMRFKMFFKFLDSNVRMTPKTYRNAEELRQCSFDYDVYCTGSDQVWNYGWNEKIEYPYFLEFAPDNKKKISYAASFGKSELEEQEIDETKRLLSRYDAISLRESSGVKIVKGLGICDCVNVLDPTLLLNGEEWRKLASGKYQDDRYILIYNLNRNSKIDNYAKNLSKETGLPVKYLSYQLHEFYKNGKMYCNPKVEDFLALIDGADYVITDSFHATAFSLNFNKEFVIVYPDRFSTRLQNILEILDLTDRVAKNEEDIEIARKKIDYLAVNRLLDIERQKSLSWLTSALQTGLLGEKTAKTVCDLNKCNGCMACLEKCHKSAITIRDDWDSFNAFIDEKLCVDCGLCKKVCPNNAKVEKRKPQLWYQGWANDSVRIKSSSGGAASAIIKAFIEHGGYVASCRFINGEFKFIATNDVKEAENFAGSKYVKSNPEGIYKKIDALLKKGEKVLFVGLPCQVAALKKFINCDERLYTIDLICHGTPSPELLKKFLQEIGHPIEKIGNLKFRMNSVWGLNDNGRSLKKIYRIDDYLINFLHAVDYTENCYSCSYAKLERVSDITLGDSWGTDIKKEEKNGISLILCQNKKGKEILDIADLQLKSVDINNAIVHNEQLNRPSRPNPQRDKFFQMLRKGNTFSMSTMKIFPVLRVKEKAKSIIKYWFKRGRIYL